MVSVLRRPKNLDKRVFFCKDFPGATFLHKHDLLYLHIRVAHNNKKFKWELEFDILESGKIGGSVAFTKDEFRQITKLFESRSFDWRQRNIGGTYSSLILYKYIELDDVVEVANQVADFAYNLHNDLTRKSIVREIYNDQYNNRDSALILSIHDEKKGEYTLTRSSGLKVDILLFKNGKTLLKGGDSYFSYESGYSREKAIQDHNSNKKNGVLLINHHLKQAEFYPTDWNTFCLMIDNREFTKEWYPIEQITTESKILFAR